MPKRKNSKNSSNQPELPLGNGGETDASPAKGERPEAKGQKPVLRSAAPSYEGQAEETTKPVPAVPKSALPAKEGPAVFSPGPRRGREKGPG